MVQKITHNFEQLELFLASIHTSFVGWGGGYYNIVTPKLDSLSPGGATAAYILLLLHYS